MFFRMDQLISRLWKRWGEFHSEHGTAEGAVPHPDYPSCNREHLSTVASCEGGSSFLQFHGSR
jgi:hypothetical protein